MRGQNQIRTLRQEILQLNMPQQVLLHAFQQKPEISPEGHVGIVQELSDS